MKPPGRPLTADPRFHLFAMLFALGCLHHEVQFILEQQRAVPLGAYLEHWARVKPTIGWPSWLGLAIHLSVVPAALAVMVLPWRRGLFCLLGVPILLMPLVSPERISSHYSLMVGAVVIVQGLALGELVERRGRPGAAPPTDWHGWTLVGLTWLVALTYFFAFFHKLNRDWLSPDGGAAAEVLLASVEPLLVPLAGSPERALALLAGPATYGTLALELALPLLLLGQRTRLLGCLFGIGFHLPMLVQRIGDFPVLVMAFYPLFLGRDGARAALARCLERPSPPRLAAGLALGAALVALSARAEPLKQLGSGTDPFLLLLRDLLIFGSLVLFAWIALALASMLLERAFAASVGHRVTGVRESIPRHPILDT